MSRVKALIGALLATLAIAGATQAAAPDSASAMKPQCQRAWLNAWNAYQEGYDKLAKFWYGVAELCEEES